jgi:hypothetical protein
MSVGIHASCDTGSSTNLLDTAWFQNLRQHSETTPDTTLYSGHSYKHLLDFLFDALTSSRDDDQLSISSSEAPEDFTLLRYVLSPRLSSIGKLQVLLPDLGVEGQVYPQASGDVIFIRGYPSARTIVRLGARYNIDPEFFLRHIDYGYSDSIGQATRSTVLPSASYNVFQIPFTSVARLGRSIKGNLAEARINADSRMKDYFDSMTQPGQWKSGDSVVRSYAVHDSEEVSITQTATCCMIKPIKPTKPGPWHGKCVFGDPSSGADLG